MTPADLKALLLASKPGESIRPKGALLKGMTLELKPSEVVEGFFYPTTGVGQFTIRGGVWAGVRLDSVTGLKVEGAEFDGPDQADGFGLFVNGGQGVTVTDCQFESYKTGLVLNKVETFEVSRNAFSRMRSDGMTIGESRKGQVVGNRFHGTRITGDEHPDFIQLYSRPTSPPTSDIVIRDNKGMGMSQGICGFNHTRGGVNDGGFDRIVIEDNDLCCGFPHAISLVEARDSRVTHNRVETYPGARYRASINTDKSPGIIRMMNTIQPGAGKAGLVDPP